MKDALPTIDVDKYGGKQVAIVDSKVVASGKTAKEVLDKAKKKKPNTSTEKIKIFAVPRTTASIYCA